MSFRLIREVWKISLKPAEKLLLLALADICNDGDNGVCWPSQSALKQHTGMAERTIRDAQKSLSESHLLSVEKHGRNRNKYTLLIRQYLPDSVRQNLPDSKPQKRQNLPDSAAKSAGLVRQNLPEHINNLPVEPTKEPSFFYHQQAGGDGETAAPPAKKPKPKRESKPKPKPEHEIDPLGKSNSQFCEFYDSYPNKQDRRCAFKAFLKLKQSERDVLLARTKEANDGIFSVREKQHIPYPATWINKRNWQDDTADLSAPKPQIHNGFVRSGSHDPVQAYRDRIEKFDPASVKPLTPEQIAEDEQEELGF